jgi:hypothetical protein
MFAARWELVGKHKSREHCRRDCVSRATVAEAIDVEYATGYPTGVPTFNVLHAKLRRTPLTLASPRLTLGRS